MCESKPRPRHSALKRDPDTAARSTETQLLAVATKSKLQATRPELPLVILYRKPAASIFMQEGRWVSVERDWLDSTKPGHGPQ